MEQEEKDEVAMYWNLRIQYAKALRANRDFPNVHAVHDNLLKDPKATFQIYADMEKNFAMEDDKKYGAALQRWNAFMKNPGLTSKLQDPKMKELYFQGYFYQIRAMFRLARHAHRVDEIGAAVSDADLDDLHQLLGHRPADWFEGEAELERFVLADAQVGRYDEVILPLLHKRNLRAQMLLGPAGSAMARHLPIQTFRD